MGHVSSYIVVLEHSQHNIMIANVGPMIGVEYAYMVHVQSADLKDNEGYVYISPAAAEAFEAPSGWSIDSNYTLNMMVEVVSEYEYDDGKVAPVGLQNEALKKLIYIDKIENGGVIAEASGEAIEVSTEAEMDAVLVEENIGKFYKFTGESTDKYTQDTIYLVQDSENPIFEDEIKDIATEAEMDAVLVEENIGKFFVYVGETTDKYTNNMFILIHFSQRYDNSELVEFFNKKAKPNVIPWIN
jgi:hypothetical protein